MKNAGILWIVGSLIMTGCVHTSQIGNGESQTLPRDMAQSVAGEQVIVNLQSEETLHGKALVISQDTLLLLDSRSDTIVRLPMSDIRSIETWASASGPVVGLVLGGVTGAAIGALIGSAIDSPGPFRAIAPAYTGALGLGIGIVAGVTIGANSTPGHRYLLPDDGTATLGQYGAGTTPEETKPTDYVTVVVKTILEETETSITFPWTDGNVTLSKSDITVKKTKDGYDIRVPRWLWYGRE